MRVLKKALYAGLIFLLLAAAFPLSAFAEGTIDPEHDASLTVRFVVDNGATPIRSTTFYLYRVADVDEGVNFTATETFRKYDLKLEGNTKDSWNTLADTLGRRVSSDDVRPDASAITNENGIAAFTGLKPGLFLVRNPSSVVENGYLYNATPFFAVLPSQDPDESWNYEPVYSIKRMNPPTAVIRVMKTWDDKNFESKRPSEVTIDLKRNGVTEKTVTLNKDNNWVYTWANLDPKAEWSVEERVPEGYEATYKAPVGITREIVNKYVAPVTVNQITVSKGITGDLPASRSNFNFQLQASDAAYPMPAGSSGSTKTITISGSGTSNFGKITFSEPGTYVYTVREIDNGLVGYTYDTTIYTVTYTVEQKQGELSVTQTITNPSGQTVSVAAFSNTYKTPGNKLPQTGLLWWPVPVLSLLGVASLAAGISRRRSCR